LSPQDCYGLLSSRVASRKQIDAFVLQSSKSKFREQVLQFFAALLSLPSFSNGRDVETLAKATVSLVMKRPMKSKGQLAITEDIVTKYLIHMIAERRSRADAIKGPAVSDT